MSFFMIYDKVLVLEMKNRHENTSKHSESICKMIQSSSAGISRNANFSQFFQLKFFFSK